METTKIKKLLKQAIDLNGILHSICGEIATELQPFFSNEIGVDFQPSDGFVVVWEDGSHKAPNNERVLDVIANIERDILCYRFSETR